MTSSEEQLAERVRLRLVWLGMIGCLAFLGIKLWRMQIVHASTYASDFERQSVRRVRLPATRGLIYDRHGVCLAGNRPSYCIAIYVEELRRPGRLSNTVDRVEEVVDQVADVIGRERGVSRRDIRLHIQRRGPMPFLAWRGIDHDVIARWAESPEPLPGVDVYVEPVRTYPNGPEASHVLGYVRRADTPTGKKSAYHYYLPEIEGKRGLEKVFNDRLAGQAGGRLLRVDASGFRYEVIDELLPQPGGNLRLTLDLRIQAAAEAVLAGQRGSVVVLDPRNGEVLAMASMPTYDSNTFSAGASREEWDRLSALDGVFVNRSVSGAYAPGSVFKPIVAIASLENRRARADTRFNCPGFFQLGDVRFGCWSDRGHGEIAMRKSIEQSCNAYFCQLGLQCGYERIYHIADALGLGRATGIELDRETGGLLPNDAWKRATHKDDAWRAGDTCNVSIGQGPLLVTPLQMAVVTAALANGGRVLRPNLVLGPGGSGGVVNRMNWSAETLETVRGGMRDVVQLESGTGKRARIPGVVMAGKTGTAEYGPRNARKHYAWMILFAPYTRPRYALALVVEDALSGGQTAAPMAARLMDNVFRIEDPTRPPLEGGAG